MKHKSISYVMLSKSRRHPSPNPLAHQSQKSLHFELQILASLLVLSFKSFERVKERDWRFYLFLSIFP